MPRRPEYTRAVDLPACRWLPLGRLPRYRTACHNGCMANWQQHLQSGCFRDASRADINWRSIASHLGPAGMADFAPLALRFLPRSADPDMALNNLERLLAQAHGKAAWPGLLENRGRGLDSLLQLLAVSQFLADTLIRDPEAIELLRPASRRNPSTEELSQGLRTEIEAAGEDSGVLRAIRKFRRLQLLRVGINDVLRDRPLEEITRDLSRIADACIRCAVQTALRTQGRKYGQPSTADGRPARLCTIAFGKLGGDELNYSSDIDLMFLYDADGETAGKRSAASLPNSEFFARVVTEVIRLLSFNNDQGFAYRVDFRLRPEGASGPLARTLASTLSYYDVMGRTWERQALIKARPVAGDPELGQEFLRAIEPFVYRKYFSFSEINEVKSLKRRMEQRAAQAGTDDLDVKTGIGGIRDIEFTVQYLQLLNGGDLPAVRQRNTLLALEALEMAGCLTPEETYRLSDAYRFLRKTEHRLQLLFDLQTHRLPAKFEELRKLARRMGYQARILAEEPRAEEDPVVPMLAAQRVSPIDEMPPAPQLDTRQLLVDPLDLFLKDYHDKARLNRAILDHLLHQMFAADAGRAEPESDLLLDPHPSPETIAAVLGKYPFRNIPAAFQNLTRLAQEAVPFLSGRRCRHFLANIAPQLLRALAATPDPDEALNNLERVTASLGAKAVLYELFSFNPPSLRLYVDICSQSPYLCSILTNNPGMIDELLDSLVLDQPRSGPELRAELDELCRGAFDLDPILHSFQDKELLRVGVQDLLGKADIRHTTAELSDIAEALLLKVFEMTEAAVQSRYGQPQCEYAIIGLGKLGGREISYHSDLDIILIYAQDGVTLMQPGQTATPTTHQHFFTELAQRAIRTLSHAGPMGRLYALDMRLRPTGRSGSLAMPLVEFDRYFAGGGAQFWERQALTRARVIRASAAFARQVESAIARAALGIPWSAAVVQEILAMRNRQESQASPRDLKRGPGGLVDIEFLVQLLILKYAGRSPGLLAPNIWDALARLEQAGILQPGEAQELERGYTYLRLVEARLRIVTDRALTEIPEDPERRTRLARRLVPAPATLDGFDAEYQHIRRRNRELFLAIAAREQP